MEFKVENGLLKGNINCICIPKMFEITNRDMECIDVLDNALSSVYELLAEPRVRRASIEESRKIITEAIDLYEGAVESSVLNCYLEGEH